MTARRRFPRSVIEALASAPMLGVRAGRSHDFTGVWVVVIRGRVFIRSWNDKATGWYRAFVEEPLGEIECGDRRVRVRARTVRRAALLDAVERAYAEKYDTKASLKWVRGFRAARRRATTTELTPR